MTKHILALGSNGSVLNCIVNEFLSSGLSVRTPLNCINAKSVIPISSLCKRFTSEEADSPLFADSVGIIFINLSERLKGIEQENINQVFRVFKEQTEKRFFVLVNCYSKVNGEWIAKIKSNFSDVIVIKASIIFESFLVGLTYSNMRSLGILRGGAYCISASDIGRQLCNIFGNLIFEKKEYKLQGPNILTSTEFALTLQKYIGKTNGNYFMKKLSTILRVLQVFSFLFSTKKGSESFCSIETWRLFGKPCISIDGFLTKLQG